MDWSRRLQCRGPAQPARHAAPAQYLQFMLFSDGWPDLTVREPAQLLVAAGGVGTDQGCLRDCAGACGFFLSGRPAPLQGARMQPQSEHLLDLPGQFVPAARRRLPAPRLDILHDRRRALVRRVRAALLRQEPIETALLEGLGQLVEMLAADAEGAGGGGHAVAFGPVAAQHLVAHLQPVAGIEESLLLKLGVADLLGMGIDPADGVQELFLGIGGLFHGAAFRAKAEVTI